MNLSVLLSSRTICWEQINKVVLKNTHATHNPYSMSGLLLKRRLNYVPNPTPRQKDTDPESKRTACTEARRKWSDFSCIPIHNAAKHVTMKSDNIDSCEYHQQHLDLQSWIHGMRAGSGDKHRYPGHTRKS